MSLNYKEIDLILEELDLSGSRIDRINQTDRYSLYLETYNNHNKEKLLFSLAQGAARLHSIKNKPDFPPAPPRFAQLLRARIKGGTIISAEQPEGERIVLLKISTRDCLYHLWIRFWGGNPNMILTDETHRIVDCLFRKKSSGEYAGECYNPDLSQLNKNSHYAPLLRSQGEYPTFNEYIDQLYSQKTNYIDFEKQSGKEQGLIKTRIKKSENHLAKLEIRKIRYRDSEHLKISGELILANLHRIEKGTPFIEVENYYDNNKMIRINLKPELTPLENSDDYFRKYKKYNQGLKFISDEIDRLKDAIMEFRSLLLKLGEATTIDQLAMVTEKIHKTPVEKKKPTAGQGLNFQSRGFEILVGRNARENDLILRKKARGNDLWLHVRDYPGGYVIIKSVKGKSIPLETLLDGANLALLYSSKKLKDKADIHYSKVKNIRRVKGGRTGAVFVEKDKNLFISYDEQRIKILQHKIPHLETNQLKSDN